MASVKPGLLGRKIGMTQLFMENGDTVAVTVIEAGPNHVVAVKKADGPDGYDAVQLGFGVQKESRVSKAELGHLGKVGLPVIRHLQEFRLQAKDLGRFSPGATLNVADMFKVGDVVDVSGTSKGRGYAGVMKRYHFKGFIRSHGTHEYFRHGGSIGTRLTPGHVLKGKKMGGHMGSESVTIQNLAVVRVDAERNLLFIKGGVPGANGGIVRVRGAIKSA
jgi:large subunit ribosomal protein L3